MTDSSGDFVLTIDELREVTRYAVEAAQGVVDVFELSQPDDARPRDAIGAAWDFVNGATRSNRQRVAARDAHRAAKEATSEAAACAAQSAGDAAAAAYLHPLAKATQVGHILRAAANAARVAELQAGDDPAAGTASINQAVERATPLLVDVLRRYPDASQGQSRVAQLMAGLDAQLRLAR
ncbi:putative immunity protein [Amycolatopsis panacis]|uniref:Exonuclease SbcC n=1 Tax=Amycolatopsis panacis TaxID=2340917 RepID=A0A419HWI0_9PSEU|nr:exonuclease SbcC [Amycolatopsis panacis]RJQ81323.1 exonuclease SbcC [Amycolatopsis panacis]